MNTINTTSKKWFEGINSIRFILAVIVILSHFDDPFIAELKNSSLPIYHTAGVLLANLFDGTAAVLAFFIISGFVIHYPNKNGIKDLKRFWTRRLIRIFIPLIIIFFIGIKFGHPEKAVVWSLICELAYYIIYPFIAAVPIKWLGKVVIAFIITFVLILIKGQNDILSLLKQSDLGYHSYYWQTGPFLTWVIGLPVWLMGVLLAENIDKLRNTTFNKLLFLRISVFIYSCVLTYGRSKLYISYLLSMNFFAIWIYLWIQAEIVYFRNRKASALLEKAGKFSYSLYLCHPLLYLLLSFWLNKTEANYPIFILLTFILSYGYYLAIEKPSHLLAERLTKHNYPKNRI